MAPALETEVARSFGDIHQVESVYVSHNAGVMNVCIFVNERDEEAYIQIYRREVDLEKKSKAISFDFSVIARHNRPIREFVGSETPAWERRADEVRAS